jgi:hypothetical protein
VGRVEARTLFVSQILFSPMRRFAHITEGRPALSPRGRPLLVTDWSQKIRNRTKKGTIPQAVDCADCHSDQGR